MEIDQLFDGIQNIPALWDKALAARSEEARALLNAMAACPKEGFLLSLATTLSGMQESQSERACKELMKVCLVRQLDADSRRFQLHGLLYGHLRQKVSPQRVQAQFIQRHSEGLTDWQGQRGLNEPQTRAIP
jgi:hypothetical protein